jgi:hypothetical protein
VARVVVRPEQFHLVAFDPDRIRQLVEEVADRVGLGPEVRVEVVVEESSPLGRVAMESLDPLVLSVHSGAFEHARRPRQLSEEAVRSVAANWLLRARDRLDPAFGQPPPDPEIPLAASTAWTVYCAGRAARAGLPAAKERRRYHFRVRHGFSDRADQVFEQLWASDGLTWAQIEAASASCRQPATA